MNLLTELKKDIKEMPEGVDKNALTKLVTEADFMAAELKKLRKDIKVNGWTEEYQNGQNQHGIKKSSAGEVYNTLVKNFRETCALVLKYISDSKKTKELNDELNAFMDMARKNKEEKNDK